MTDESHLRLRCGRRDYSAGGLGRGSDFFGDEWEQYSRLAGRE